MFIWTTDSSSNDTWYQNSTVANLFKSSSDYTQNGVFTTYPESRRETYGKIENQTVYWYNIYSASY